jgi:riboflavin kinase / FMN adenylyltransferase
VQIWRDTGDVPADLGRSVVVIGNFDGVHLGHRRVIARAREIADERGLEVVAVTFDPHPMAVLRPDHAPITLSSIEERAELLAQAGADDVLVLPFTTEVAGWSPEEFVDRILVDLLHAAAVVVGANFRFGHRAAGDVELLTQLGQRFGFGVEGLDLIRDDGVTFSSTYIRACIDAGDVAAADAALGRPHRVEGVVVHGDRRGRELGFPTANIATAPHTALPADGVYAGRFVLGGTRLLPTAISVGTNPTFSGRVRTVEAFVLDVDEDFYGHEVGVDFVARVRGQERFDRIEDLVTQMHRDVERVRELLSG